jgi:hypothetical protein
MQSNNNRLQNHSTSTAKLRHGAGYPIPASCFCALTDVSSLAYMPSLIRCCARLQINLSNRQTAMQHNAYARIPLGTTKLSTKFRY